jgi:hypothetical protein
MTGRKSKDLTPFKEEILDLTSQNKSRQEIVSYLLRIHSFSITRQTLAKSIQEWTDTKEERTEKTDQLEAQIANIFFSAYGITDEKMLKILREEGYTITLRGLISIRKELGIYRRESSNAPQKSTEELIDLVNEKLKKGGILGWGRVHMTTYFRQQRVVIPRYSL